MVYLYFKNNNVDFDANINNILRNYIFLLCLNSFYSKSTNQKLQKNIDFCNDLLKGEKSLNQIKEHYWEDFGIKEIDSKILLEKKFSKSDMLAKIICSFFFNINTLTDFYTGNRIDESKYDLHHLYPRNGYKEFKGIEKVIESYANMSPIDPKTNKAISNKKFSKYLVETERNRNKKIKEEMLNNHFVDVELWIKDDNWDDMKKALEDRAKKHANKLNKSFIKSF